jgi:predicted RNase H-like HicB family nuclease
MPIELEREVDGRWIAGVRSIPGVIVYGSSSEQAGRGAAAFGRRDRGPADARGAGAGDGCGRDALTIVVGSHVATVLPGEATSLLVGYVDGLPGAHSQAESLDELFLNLSEVIGLVTENGSAPDNLREERSSAREN